MIASAKDIGTFSRREFSKTARFQPLKRSANLPWKSRMLEVRAGPRPSNDQRAAEINAPLHPLPSKQFDHLDRLRKAVAVDRDFIVRKPAAVIRRTVNSEQGG
jgi:hypothetical protein